MGYSLSKAEMGRRLSIARNIAGLDVRDAARAAGVSPSRLSSVENGSMALEINEIDSLADYYGISTGRLLSHDAIHIDLVPRFKKHSKTEDKHKFEAVKLLNNLFSVESELENLLGIEHSTNYPDRLEIGKGNVKEQALEHARILRKFLGLGNNPIPDIFSIIEKKLRIRLYQCRLGKGSKIFGLFAFDEALGACILLNSMYSRPYRMLIAAHELGHFMVDRKKVVVSEEDKKASSRNERYATNFSYAFMMPEESFLESFRKISHGADELSYETVIKLANKFNVPSYACVNRLCEFGLVEDRKKWMKLVGKTDFKRKKAYLGNEQYAKRYSKENDADRIIPNRIGVLAHRAWKRGFFSEGYLASMLKLGRIEVRKILFEIESGVQFDNPNDSPKEECNTTI